MLEAVFSLAFFGFLRCGEFTCTSVFDQNYNPTMGDLQVVDKSCLTLRLKSSKTDPFRRGVSIRLFKTGNNICPVTAIEYYLTTLPPIQKLVNMPLFLNQNLQPLTRTQFLVYMRQVLVRTGLDVTQFSGHSFRIGAATTCSAQGVEDHLIKTLGRWTSDCYTRYIRTPNSAIALAHRQMCK